MFRRAQRPCAHKGCQVCRQASHACALKPASQQSVTLNLNFSAALSQRLELRREMRRPRAALAALPTNTRPAEGMSESCPSGLGAESLALAAAASRGSAQRRVGALAAKEAQLARNPKTTSQDPAAARAKALPPRVAVPPMRNPTQNPSKSVESGTAASATRAPTSGIVMSADSGGDGAAGDASNGTARSSGSILRAVVAWTGNGCGAALGLAVRDASEPACWTTRRVPTH